MDARFDDVAFGGAADFAAAVALQDVHFPAAVFRRGATFREAKVRVAHFCEDVVGPPRWPWSTLREAARPVVGAAQRLRRRPRQAAPEPQFGGDVDLRGFSYERIYVDWDAFLGKLAPYDRQPYTEMEAAFRRMGDDRGANDVYYERRLRESRIRRRWRHRSEWPRLLLVDLPHRGLAGYGVRALRFLAVVAAVLVIGTFVFGQVDAVAYRSEADRQASGGRPVDLDGAHAFLVSLDQLLPSPVDVPGGRRWEPSSHEWWEVRGVSLSYADYASVPNLVGWVLVPVGIAILAGALRRQT